MTSIKIGQLFSLAYTKPVAGTSIVSARPGSLMFFYVTGAFTVQQTVYADSGLTTPLAQPIVADANGRFAPVFLNPALQYSWQLLTSGSVLLQQADPVNVQNTSISVQITKPNFTSRVSTTTLTADPDLTYAIPAAGTYRVEFDLGMNSAASGATPGIKLEVNFTGTLNAAAGNTFAIVGLFANTAVTSAQSSVGINLPVSGSLSLVAAQNILRIMGTIQATSAGTLSLFWSQSVSSASASSILKASAMSVTQIG